MIGFLRDFGILILEIGIEYGFIFFGKLMFQRFFTHLLGSGAATKTRDDRSLGVSSFSFPKLVVVYDILYTEFDLGT